MVCLCICATHSRLVSHCNNIFTNLAPVLWLKQPPSPHHVFDVPCMNESRLASTGVRVYFTPEQDRHTFGVLASGDAVFGGAPRVITFRIIIFKFTFDCLGLSCLCSLVNHLEMVIHALSWLVSCLERERFIYSMQF